MKRWNMCAAFLSPNGNLTNSNNRSEPSLERRLGLQESGGMLVQGPVW